MRPWRRGDTGDAVLALQQRLEELGYLTEEYDGHYGATTADCVSRFQEANGLTADGVASPETQLAPVPGRGALREDGTPPCRMRRSLPPAANPPRAAPARLQKVPPRRALPAVQSPPRTVLPLLKAPPLRKGRTTL